MASAAVLVLAGWMAWRNWEDGRWNDRAIAAQCTGFIVQRQNQRDVHLVLHYNLTNATQKTYRLAAPPLGVIMQRVPEGDLQALDLAVWDPIAIPAGKTVAAVFDVPLAGVKDVDNPEENPDTSDETLSDQALQAFANRQLSRIRGLVFYDYGRRYSIDLPKGWP